MIQRTSELSVRRQCELLELPRSSLYSKPVPEDPEKLQWEEDVMAHIDYWHTMMLYLGSRKLVTKLHEDGLPASRKVVRRLMNKMGLRTIYPKINLSKRNFKEAIVPYRLRNKFIFLPNQAWSIDITYIKRPHGHMYLTAIIDWHSRYIVGWNLSDTLDTMYVVDAVKAAVSAHGTPGILNSDQGSQFTSSDYKQLLKDYHIVQSMDGKSRWADNIMIERWFRSLKVEEIYPNEYANPRELRRAIARYINEYNTLRPHGALDNRTPASVYYASFSSGASEEMELAS